MRILVVGAGSIGKRHAQNLASQCDVCLYDANISNAQNEIGTDSILYTNDLHEAKRFSPQGAIICVPTHKHLEVAKQFVACKGLLIEKPISHNLVGIEGFMEELHKNDTHVFVVNNIRFHPGPQGLYRHLKKVGNVYYARAEFANFLPSMRPNIDYRSLYAAKKNEGGGALLDCIHELDYLSWLFGEVIHSKATLRKLSNLEIDVEDFAAYHLEHSSGVISEVKVDYLRRLKKRGCEIVGEKGILKWISHGKKPEHFTLSHYDYSQEEWSIYEDRNLTLEESLYSLQQVDEKFLRFLTTKDSEDLLSVKEGVRELEVCVSLLEKGEFNGYSRL